MKVRYRDKMTTTANREMKVESKALYVPDKEELCRVLEDGLKTNFANVSVSFIDCPDLTQLPFSLAAPGLSGSPRLADVGGIPNLIPLVNKDKVYDIEKVAEQAKLPGAFVLGAGAGSSHYIGVNCELMANIKTKGSGTDRKNCTHISKVNPDDQSCVLQKCESTEFGLMANLFLSEGKPGKVIEVKVSKRTGDENFVTCMRKSLENHYKDKVVGLGGTFLIEQGKAKFHVMPAFSKSPLNTHQDVDHWLRFYDMKAPLVCFSCLLSVDPGLDLRLEHSHGFGHHGEGGHYHYDVTPDEVIYRGYYQVAESVFRIDAPTETHTD